MKFYQTTAPIMLDIIDGDSLFRVRPGWYVVRIRGRFYAAVSPWGVPYPLRAKTEWEDSIRLSLELDADPVDPEQVIFPDRSTLADIDYEKLIQNLEALVKKE